MGIKEQRGERREKLFGQFVSVKSLIDHFAIEEGLDISDMAAELERIINCSDDSNLPEYGYVDVATFEFVTNSWELSGYHLMGMLSDTIMGCGHGDDSDHFGWLRDDLFPFLQSHGFDVPVDFPPWSPTEVVFLEGTQTEGNALEIGTANFSDQPQCIQSEIIARLSKAIEAFPVNYPDYKSKPPKLNMDVRPWLHREKFVKDGERGREAMIFGRVIAEHFKLSGDTQKTS